MTAQAGTACRCGDDAACIVKDLEPPVIQCLSVNLLGARNNDTSYILMYLKALEDRSGGADIL